MEKPYSLTKNQRESFALINIGSFLEYFDFKTYIHITVILNALFFPISDSYSQSLLSAFSFSMAYILRPLGSFLFGLLGDLWGRKVNIIITTMMMSLACFILASMPTYAQVGWYASIAVLICRFVQGIASGVELIGAIVYTAESVKAPYSYFYTALVGIAADCGALFALAMCTIMLTLRPDDGWRYVFLLGSAIALIGSMARTRLKESPEFLNAKKRNILLSKDKQVSVVHAFTFFKRNIVTYFLIELPIPLLFYISFIVLNEFLTKNYGYAPLEIIRHNLYITLCSSVTYLGCSILTRYFYPFHLLKFMGWTLFSFSLLLPFIVHEKTSLPIITLIQILIYALAIPGIGYAIYTKGFPTIGRYTVMGTVFSTARAITAVTTSYGCVFINNQFGLKGIFILLMIMMSLHLLGLYFFVPTEEDKIIEKKWKKGKLFGGSEVQKIMNNNNDRNDNSINYIAA